VKRNRFIQLSGGTRSVNRTLKAKARALAGLKGYVTNLAACPTHSGPRSSTSSNKQPQCARDARLAADRPRIRRSCMAMLGTVRDRCQASPATHHRPIVPN
jgi:hypothetical protein